MNSYQIKLFLIMSFGLSLFLGREFLAAAVAQEPDAYVWTHCYLTMADGHSVAIPNVDSQPLCQRAGPICAAGRPYRGISFSANSVAVTANENGGRIEKCTPRLASFVTGRSNFNTSRGPNSLNIGPSGNPLPPGSYRQSCKLCDVVGQTLSCKCDGNNTSILMSTCLRNDYCNHNGVLQCGEGC